MGAAHQQHAGRFDSGRCPHVEQTRRHRDSRPITALDAWISPARPAFGRSRKLHWSTQLRLRDGLRRARAALMMPALLGLCAWRVAACRRPPTTGPLPTTASVRTVGGKVAERAGGSRHRWLPRCPIAAGDALSSGWAGGRFAGEHGPLLAEVAQGGGDQKHRVLAMLARCFPSPQSSLVSPEGGSGRSPQPAVGPLFSWHHHTTESARGVSSPMAAGPSRIARGPQLTQAGSMSAAGISLPNRSPSPADGSAVHSQHACSRSRLGRTALGIASSKDPAGGHTSCCAGSVEDGRALALPVDSLRQSLEPEKMPHVSQGLVRKRRFRTVDEATHSNGNGVFTSSTKLSTPKTPLLVLIQLGQIRCRPRTG